MDTEHPAQLDIPTQEQAVLSCIGGIGHAIFLQTAALIERGDERALGNSSVLLDNTKSTFIAFGKINLLADKEIGFSTRNPRSFWISTSEYQVVFERQFPNQPFFLKHINTAQGTFYSHPQNTSCRPIIKDLAHTTLHEVLAVYSKLTSQNLN